jgi:hypothetical protein
MPKLLQMMGRLFREMVPPFLFCLIMFHILAVTRMLALREFGIRVSDTALTTVLALLVAKAIVIADKIPFINLYPRRPLIYTVILKTITFSLVSLVFLFVEEYTHCVLHYGGDQASAHLMSQNNWPMFWFRQIWLSITLLAYCAGMELVRAIGAERVEEIYFGKGR